MFIQPNVRSELQQRLDQTRDLEDVVPDQAATDEECGFQMTGLYEVIPGTDPSPLRIDAWSQNQK